jgi:hypothetical protein
MCHGQAEHEGKAGRHEDPIDHNFSMSAHGFVPFYSANF